MSAQSAPALQSPLKRTVLQTHALTTTPGHEGIAVLAELAAASACAADAVIATVRHRA